MAAMPPQPPGGPPQQPPAYPPGGPPPQQPPYPGAYPSQMPQGGYPPAYYQTPGYPGAPVRRRTGWMTFAQVIVIIEAVLFLLIGIGLVAFGIYVASHGDDLNAALSNVSGYTPVTTHLAGAVFYAIGGVILVLAIIWLILGITLGRPSNVSRWIIVVFVILAVVGQISSLANRYAGGAVIGPIVLIALNALILYALIFDPATRRAFESRRY